MRILLVYPNTYRFLNPQPLGLAMVARSAVSAGHEVRLLDMMIEDKPEAALFTALADGSWDLVGFSLRNLDNQDLTDSQDFVPDYARFIGLASHVAPTVVGGSALMSMPEEVFTRTGATYGICGQADTVFSDFLAELAAGATSFETPGAMWWEHDEPNVPQVRRNPGLLNGYADDGTIPWEHIQHERYSATEMGFPVITSTGCPYKCLFCDTPASFGDCFVPRPAERIVEDLERDSREGRLKAGTFFVDACFNEPLDYAKEVLEAIIRSDLTVGFSAIVEPTPSIDREFVRLFKQAGGMMTTCLLGSVGDGMLERLRRPYDVASVKSAFDLFESEGVAYMPQFLFGGPGETQQTVDQSFEFLDGCRPLLADFAVGLRINPKAGLYDVALQDGMITQETDMLVPRFYVAEGLDTEAVHARGKAWKRRIPPLGQWTRYLSKMLRVRFA
jgi:radical SAM superfamily enzyme YgiQ (UPF0313 family)